MSVTPRVVTQGKHLAAGGRPYKVRGVTYGTFLPRLDGELFPDTAAIKQDLVEMERLGLNTIRTYTLPSPDLLDLAEEHGLRLIVGLHYDDWRNETHPGRAARRRVLDSGRRAIDAAMERLQGRPHVMAISVGNELPADLVRFFGIGAVEDAYSSLTEEVHRADEEVLVTYTNFPTTEYLHVEGQDIVCFNVFLEQPDRLRRYVDHLQVLSGDLPLVLTELGLASEIHGEPAQASSIEEQLRVVDESGCAGATVFQWTDEWAVGGHEVRQWGFGVTDAERVPKPAARILAAWARRSPRDLRTEWPEISAVVCAYNEERHIGAAIESLLRTDYPNLEIIVCDDGSSDGTVSVARAYPVTVLELPHSGLSVARNAGIDAAQGNIIGFIDADAQCHPEWPYYIALSLEEQNVAGTGGPNLPVPGAEFIERAVARSPGGPIHVLISDDRAEHVPGCNMAFMKAALIAVGGFDPVYTSAGDDVDVCWKLLDGDYQIAFSPAAQVFHHRRNSIAGYLRQQRGYGRSEALVYRYHRHRFNRLGQARWAGFIYGGPRPLSSLLRPLIYHGPMGLAPFQQIVRRRAEPALAWSSALLPLSVPAIVVGLALSFLSQWWLLMAAVVLALVAVHYVSVAIAVRPDRGEPRPAALRIVVAALHVSQSVVRAWGRLNPRASSYAAGYTPAQPPPTWTGDRATWLFALKRRLASRHCAVRLSEYDETWDLEASIGPLTKARVTTAVVWHWTPIWRVSVMPRAGALIVVAVGLVWAALASPAGGAIAAVVTVAATAEGWMLRHLVTRGLNDTTRDTRRQ